MLSDKFLPINSLWKPFILVICSLLYTPVFAQPFTISTVTNNPSKEYKRLKPMADYLAANLAEFGYTEGAVLMAKDVDRLVDYLDQGKVDLVTETLFVGLEINEKTGAELLLRKWANGQRDYRTVILTRKDSGIKDIADLNGKIIAFEKPTSTSAYFTPAGILLKNGLKLQPLKSINDPAPAEKVGYLFSGGELNTSFWVYQNVVDAGALSDKDWNNPRRMPTDYRQEMKIIFTSKKIPRAVEIVRAGMSNELKDRLKDLMLNLNSQPDSTHILQAYGKTSQFEEIDPETNAIIEEIRTTLILLRAQSTP